MISQLSTKKEEFPGFCRVKSLAFTKDICNLQLKAINARAQKIRVGPQIIKTEVRN